MLTSITHRFSLALLLTLALTVPSIGDVDAKTAKSPSAKRAKKSKRATKSLAKRRALAKHRAKTRRVKRKRIKRRGSMRGHGVDKSELRKEPLPKPSGNVWIWSPNFREEVRVNIYNADGSFNQSSLAALDNGFRCKRTKEARAVDPRLYEVLSIIQDHFGGKRVELTSGFRFQQNEGSRHFHASAMDIRVEGVPMRELWEFAQTLDRGGMGIGKYPRAGFIHIDFRAPGEPSYRWTDRSRGNGRGRGKAPSNAARPRS